MAIRIVDNKGIADTQAELLASTQADNINFYCVDTGNTFTSINSNFTSGVIVGVEDDITVQSNTLYYICDTSNAGKDITITFPTSLPEGVEYTVKRADNSIYGAYKIFFDFDGYTCDFDINNTNEYLKGDYDTLSFIRFNSNWNIK